MRIRAGKAAWSRAGALVVGALVFALAGCGTPEDIAESAVERAMEEAAESDASGSDEAASDGTSDGFQGGEDVEVDIDADGGTMTFENEDASMAVGEGAELPETFPEDLPLPLEDYSVTLAMEESSAVQVSLQTTGDFDALTAHLEEGAEAAGYTIADRSSSTMEDFKQVMFTAKGNGRNAFIMLASGEDGISLTYRVESEEAA